MSAAQPLAPSPRFVTAPAANSESFLEPMAQQLSTLESRAEWASQQFGALVGDISALRHGLMSAQEHARRVFAANQTLGGKLNQMASELARVQAQRDVARQEGAEFLEIARRIAEDHSELEGELAAERAKSVHFVEAIGEMQRAMGRSEAAAQRATHDQARVAQLEAAVAELEGALDRAEGEARRWRSEVAERDAELDRVAEAMVAVCGVQDRLESAKAELEAALDDEGDDRATLLAALRERDAELAELHREVERERAVAQSRAAEKAEAEKANDALRSEVTRLRAKLLAR